MEDTPAQQYARFLAVSGQHLVVLGPAGIKKKVSSFFFSNMMQELEKPSLLNNL